MGIRACGLVLRLTAPRITHHFELHCLYLLEHLSMSRPEGLENKGVSQRQDPPDTQSAAGLSQTGQVWHLMSAMSIPCTSVKEQKRYVWASSQKLDI